MTQVPLEPAAAGNLIQAAYKARRKKSIWGLLTLAVATPLVTLFVLESANAGLQGNSLFGICFLVLFFILGLFFSLKQLACPICAHWVTDTEYTQFCICCGLKLSRHTLEAHQKKLVQTRMFAMALFAVGTLFCGTFIYQYILSHPNEPMPLFEKSSTIVMACMAGFLPAISILMIANTRQFLLCDPCTHGRFSSLKQIHDYFCACCGIELSPKDKTSQS